MVIDDDRIEYVGTDVDLTSSTTNQDSDTEVIDLQGRHVLPAFIDGHMHLLFFGSSLSKIGLDNCTNLQQIRETIKKAAKQRPDAKNLFCRGWKQRATDREALASMIDDIDPRPIFIDSDDLHSVWCSSAALRALNVQDMPDPAGGKIHRDEKGNPSGLLSEGAVIAIAWPFFMKESTAEEQLQYLRLAIRAYNAAGYTGVIEMAMDAGIWSLLETLRDEEQLTLRIAAHWLIADSGTDEGNLAQVEQAITMHKRFNLTTSPDFRIAGIKVISDGVVDSCTAALSEPYTVNDATVDPIWSRSALEKVVRKADGAGLQIAIHAIGDAAVTLAIGALESLGTKNRRHRIEHLELTRPGDAKRLAEQGITASIQPVHSDPILFHAWPKLIGPDRCCRAFAYREFADHGARLAIGTDAPTAPHLPFKNLYTATTRRSARDPRSKETLNEHFKLGVIQSLSAATHGAAYSCFADEMVGTLETGKKADFVVVDGFDETDPASLMRARVVETWFNGKQIFRLHEGPTLNGGAL